MKILIAEDDLHTRDGLAEVMRDEGYDVVTASCGQSAIRMFEAHTPDCICLDIMMPERSGYEVCRSIREQSPEIPILFISAKSEEVDRLVGFDLGADDFISKPFSVREVIARIRAVTRRTMRTRPKPPAPFQMGDLQILPAELRAKRGETTIELSLRDVRILELLSNRHGQPVDRQTLFKHAWGEKYLPSSRTLDQHISQLRKRIEVDPKEPKLIQTVHGVGYRYEIINESELDHDHLKS